MGNPDIYYRRVLQTFASALAIRNEETNAKKFLEEENISKLETYILKQKLETETKFFYYDAGRTLQQELENIYYNEGIDALNACFGGFILFEELIGIIEEEDED